MRFVSLLILKTVLSDWSALLILWLVFVATEGWLLCVDMSSQGKQIYFWIKIHI